MSTYESDGNEADEYPWRNRELLERLYHEEQMSQREIADALNSDKATIYRWMVRHDIDCRPVGGQRMSKPYKDRDTLETLYHRKKMTQAEIADELNTSPTTVRYWMDKHDIETRPEGVYQSMGRGPLRLRTGPRGYERFQISDDGESTPVYLHRLLAVAIYGLEETSKSDVHHKNGLEWGNWPENLEVMTPSEHRSHHAKEQERDSQGFIA